MAASEVLARVADVASSDLLDFIVLPRQESFASLHILTRRASEGSEALPSLARRVRMSFFGARVIELAHRLPLRYRRHRDRRGVRQGRPADAEACHRRLPTSSEGL